MSCLLDIEKCARERFIPIMRTQTADFLKRLVVEIQPHRILEIGTAVGFSGILMLLNAPNDATLDTIDIDNDRLIEARENFDKAGVGGRVKCICADALDVIAHIDDKYDLIVVDGPKSKYKDFLPYVENLLNDGGAVFTDNVFFFGLVNSEDKPPKKHRTIVRNLRSFKKLLDESPVLTTEYFDIEDGFAISKKI